jgi:hypothetical protein
MPTGGFFWYSSAVQAVQIGESEYTSTKRTAGYSYANGLEAPVIYDTGTSLIYAPGGVGYELLARMVGDNTHYFDYYSGIMLTSCAEKSRYETVYLWIDDYRFEISVDDYWIEYNDIVDEYDPEAADTCLLAIIDSWSGYWLVGDAFLKGYYSIHDNEDHANAKMGFAPHATSAKQVVQKLTKPTIDLLDILWETTWIGLLANPSNRFSLGFYKFWSKAWIWAFGIYPMS